MPTLKYKDLIKNLKNKIYHPIYLLHGEESYFIDYISEYIENNVLSESEKVFNQAILYGRDVSIEEIVDYCRQVPMMANYKIVIIREAQLLNNIEKLEKYAENPTKSTILVICYKDKKLKSTTKLYKNIDKNGIIFESKPLTEKEVQSWIVDFLKNSNYTITPEALALLTSYTGTDLSKINNEFSKLMLNLPPGNTITEKHIQENFGITKRYNIFELIKAIFQKNANETYKITAYLANNIDQNPLQLIIANLFDNFVKLQIYIENQNKNENEIANLMGINKYFLDQYKNAAKNYSMAKIRAILYYLHEIDLKSKGVNNISVTNEDLLKELVFKILH